MTTIEAGGSHIEIHVSTQEALWLFNMINLATHHADYPLYTPECREFIELFKPSLFKIVAMRCKEEG